MYLSRHRRSLSAAALLLALGAAAPAAAQSAAGNYPEHPIRVVVGFPPGGGGDTYGRIIAEGLARASGKTVIVDNKPGAGGTIAADAVAKSKPDGYTLLIAMSGNFGTAPVLRSDLPYKVPDDFVPIALLVQTPYGLMVGEQSPIKSAREFVQEARKRSLSYASTGTGGAAQIVMEMLKERAKIDVLHVPYKGSGPAITDLLGGRTDSFFAPYTPLMGQIRGGKLRLLATSGDNRIADLPDVPTLKESGIDLVMTQWYGLAAPAGTPPEIIKKLTEYVHQALKQPEVLRVYRADGASESGMSGEAFRQFIVKDIENYRQGIQAAKIKLD